MTRELRLECAGCGFRTIDAGYLLYCPRCDRGALLRSDYDGPLKLSGPPELFSSYMSVLPAESLPVARAPRMACFRADELAQVIGLDELWVLLSGYAPAWGADFASGSFKECEALAVLARVGEQTDKTLIISSAGNAGRAFLDIGTRTRTRVVVLAPEAAEESLRVSAPVGDPAPLLLVLEDAIYHDAISAVDRLIAERSSVLVREGGVYNVARRDALGVPFLYAVSVMGGLPERYVQAVGSGTGAIAAWEARRRLIRMGLVEDESMRLHLIQNAPFIPMFDAWRRGSRTVTAYQEADLRCRLASIHARVLANSTPPYGVAGGVCDVLMESGGTMTAVTNGEILGAVEAVRHAIEVEACPAAGAAAAGLIQSIADGSVRRSERVLLHLTGAGMGVLNSLSGSQAYPQRVKVRRNDVESMKALIDQYLAA